MQLRNLPDGATATSQVRQRVNLTKPNLTLMPDDLQHFWGISILYRFIWDNVFFCIRNFQLRV